MDQMSDQLLMETYIRAVQMNLDEDFKAIIVAELNRRGISETEVYQHMELQDAEGKIQLYK